MFVDITGKKRLKAGFHTHTTNSDGRLTPDEAIALYAAAGYDILALTDHWKPGEGSENDPSGLLVLSGAEYNYNGSDVLKGVFHIIGVGYEYDPALTPAVEPQDAVDAINNAGGLAFLAHPAWSLNTHEMVEKFHGLFATEIYNSVSGTPRNCRPYSGQIVDELAARGYFLPLIATDDTHFWLGEEGMSYIWVNLGVKPLNRENLLAALRAGKFFGTQGPFIDARIEDGKFVVTCEGGAKSMTMFSNLPWEHVRYFEAEGDTLTECRFPIHRDVTFMRAEVKNSLGQTGYTQVFKIER
jgi:hypothetical protein